MREREIKIYSLIYIRSKRNKSKIGYNSNVCKIDLGVIFAKITFCKYYKKFSFNTVIMRFHLQKG